MPETKPKACSACNGTCQRTCPRCGGTGSDAFVESAICIHCDATGRVKCVASSAKGKKAN
ncbi:uncharacterized protein PpBr36_06771 [Pyricularia pennisetigena]|uniref:uncharacterized protein n=1 Tax=Pyricularia pennisetigena TaxID=1578925 RepID=UPI00114F6D33|nr:uncharacterized protein PpBr36_06771 [Pyricularia pennisetigena]TLS23236.1 hypothetical protein PpBr36_06771 [Pyricularia pennisetigena]